MPMHDWTRVSAGMYHDFHQGWTIELRNGLNRGVLPDGYYAMADQRVQGPEPDVATFLHANGPGPKAGLAVLDAPPKVRYQAKTETNAYARKANRVRVYDSDDRVVAVIEIVSSGNKDTRHAVRSFVGKAVEFLTQGVNVLLVDPFPPTIPAPDGLHLAIWGEVSPAPLGPNPVGQPLTTAAFDGVTSAYLEPFAVGDPVPTMPLFLGPGWYVNVPLEASYAASWESLPPILQDRVLTPK